ncbi:MAG TPA: heliorhodopsin HeR [Patescibacteria group bacterium]|nr:heliorhodopsin HeR [Patescibacteria group bacterium]
MVKQTTSKKKANKKTAAKSNANVKNVKEEVVKTAVTPAVKATAKATTGTPATKMARWYKWSGVVYLVASAVVAFLAKEVAAPVTLQYPSIDALASEANGHQVMGLASRHIADVHLGWIVVTFLAIFGVVNLMLATMYRPYLEPSLKRGVNAFRWLSLGFGGGMMVVAIAMVSGFTSLALLLSLFAFTLLGCLLALAAETVVTNNGGIKTRFAHFMCGLSVISSSAPWVVFGLAMLGAGLWHGHFTSYMYSIYICQFVLFLALISATHFRLKRQGKWADALYTDRAFLVLTFVSSALLAAQIFVGVLK